MIHRVLAKSEIREVLSPLSPKRWRFPSNGWLLPARLLKGISQENAPQHEMYPTFNVKYSRQPDPIVGTSTVGGVYKQEQKVCKDRLCGLRIILPYNCKENPN